MKMVIILVIYKLKSKLKKNNMESFKPAQPAEFKLIETHYGLKYVEFTDADGEKFDYKVIKDGTNTYPVYKIYEYRNDDWQFNVSVYEDKPSTPLDTLLVDFFESNTHARTLGVAG
jgi:hypothetical protein